MRTSLAVVALLVLTGCSGTDDDTAAEEPTPASSSAAPTEEESPSADETDESDENEGDEADGEGDEITGTAYSYRVPEGWGIPEQEIPGFAPDSLAANLDDGDGFADNVTVVLSPAGEITPDQIENAGKDELEGAGAKEITVNDRVTIAGGESAHLTAVMSANDTSYTVDQFYPTQDGQTYVMTFSFSEELSADERAEVTEATLASWTWTD